MGGEGRGGAGRREGETETDWLADCLAGCEKVDVLHAGKWQRAHLHPRRHDKPHLNLHQTPPAMFLLTDSRAQIQTAAACLKCQQ